MRDLAKLALIGILIALLCAVAPGIPGQQKPGLGAQVDGGHPLAQGLVGAWLFNEGGGGQATDISGRGNHGTLTNGPAWTAGIRGTALKFPGTNEYINVANESAFDFADADFTISAWINQTSALADWKNFISKEASDNSGWMFRTDTSGLNFFLRSGSTWFQVNYGSFVIGRWYNVVATRRNSALSLYVDGTERASTTITGSSNTNNLALQIGGTTALASRYFPGLIDSVIIRNRALTHSEIQQLYIDPYAFIRPITISRALFGSPAGAPPANKLNRLLITD